MEIESELYNSQNIEYGVPQVSILGPLLFSLYINNLQLQGSQASIIMYADDTVIVFSHTDYIHIQTVLNNELRNVKAWLDKHKLTLNTKKTKYMIFGSQKQLHKVGPMKIEIGDQEIERVKSFKYLEVYLDEVMTYKEHVSKVVKKISSRKGVLSKVVRYVTLDNRKLLFNTIILPHFDYCRMLIGVPEHVFKELKWTDISTHWQQQKLYMVFMISKGDAPDYMLNYFEELKNLHNHNTQMAARGGYTLPKINNDSGKRTFRDSGAQSWNKLPTHVWKSQNKNIFKTECVKHI